MKTEPKPFEPQTFTPETLAARWHCSTQHIRDLVTRGELPAFRIGRLIRIHNETIREIERGVKRSAREGD